MGLTENSPQFLRWMVSGPEIARLIMEYESIQDVIKTNQTTLPKASKVVLFNNLKTITMPNLVLLPQTAQFLHHIAELGDTQKGRTSSGKTRPAETMPKSYTESWE